MTAVWVVVLALVAALVGSFGPVLMKRGLAKGRKVFVLAGVGAYGVSVLMFLPALKEGSLMVVYALTASQYAWVTLWSVVLLKERVSAARVAAVACVVVGVCVVGYAG
jgi:drug/metabolite transporter (DMT)-like permease